MELFPLSLLLYLFFSNVFFIFKNAQVVLLFMRATALQGEHINVLSEPAITLILAERRANLFPPPPPPSSTLKKDEQLCAISCLLRDKFRLNMPLFPFCNCIFFNPTFSRRPQSSPLFRVQFNRRTNPEIRGRSETTSAERREREPPPRASIAPSRVIDCEIPACESCSLCFGKI